VSEEAPVSEEVAPVVGNVQDEATNTDNAGETPAAETSTTD
jgi:hypothetical protein